MPLLYSTQKGRFTNLIDVLRHKLGINTAETDINNLESDVSALQAQTNAFVPSGAIIMWTGSPAGVPAGYRLCDGSNGTPDLRGRFVVGAGTFSQYGVGDTGGQDFVTLTENEMPAHSHSINDPGHDHQLDSSPVLDQDIGVAATGDVNNLYTTQHSTSTETTGITIQDAGGGQPHENRPPFYALAYIMKL